MQLDDLVKIVGIAASVGALVGGLISWLWKYVQQSDRITVRFGTAHYEETPAYGMHVISRRDHKMEITDFGFVLMNGKLVSAPVVWEQVFDDGNPYDGVSGSKILTERNARFEATMQLYNMEVVGAYAETSTQNHSTLGFSSRHALHWWDRIRIRLKQYIKPEFN
ncbi:hypothetical protein GmRootV213_32080 [Variovorax sp. V213]|uniref:hypothetical protein n=1 Tax=Variovorax sp. V213 TaxID=3065955 RepID=UPI0034E878D6